MAEYCITAYDFTDADALNRRMEVRPEHLAYIRPFKEKGHFVNGGAILDDAGKMIGSVLLMRFDSRADFDQYLQHDPYVVGKVWDKIEIKTIRLVQFD